MFTLILIIGLLLIGLIQSILELDSNSEYKSKKHIAKVLSYIYFLGFLIAIVISIIQFNDEKKKEEFISKLSLSVSKIDTSLDIQLSKINNSIEKTNELINLSDSINSKIEEVVDVKDSLMTQYKEINGKFSQQLDYDLKLLNEKAPVVNLLDSDLCWEGTDSTQYRLKACFKNYGKRNAIITYLGGKIVLFNSKNNVVQDIEMASSSCNLLLMPTEQNEMAAYIFSYGINNLKSFYKNFEYAIININITYKDDILNTSKVEEFYKIWIPKEIGFGIPKDWQINLTKKYLEKGK